VNKSIVKLWKKYRVLEWNSKKRNKSSADESRM